MPTLKQAARADMKGWERVPESASGTSPKPSIPDESNTPGRSPNMLASMPLMAATGDAFQRQFYGGGNIPTQRILPTWSGGGA